MKKIISILTMIVLISVVTQSCKKNNNKEKKSFNKEFLTIDSENIPDLSDFDYNKSLIRVDLTKETILNMKNNTLKIPVMLVTTRNVTTTYSIKSKNNYYRNTAPEYTWHIAKRHADRLARKYPRCQGSCKCGIGFRCGGHTEYPKLNNNISPRDRDQPATIVYDENNSVVEIHFTNEVDWEYLNCN